jgi:hypothetical protein
MAKLKATYMSHKPCKNLKYKGATKTLSACNGNALLKHIETHALFEALEEDKLTLLQQSYFLKELSSLHMDKSVTTPIKHCPFKSAKRIMTQP